MKLKNLTGGIVIALLFASCAVLPKGITTDCKDNCKNCDKVTVQSRTGKTYTGYYCDSTSQWRDILDKLEGLQ